MPAPNCLKFIYLLRLTRPEAFIAPTPDEEASIEAHFQRLQEALRQGRLVLAGPCLDGAFGVVIFYAQYGDRFKICPHTERASLWRQIPPFEMA